MLQEPLGVCMLVGEVAGHLSLCLCFSHHAQTVESVAVSLQGLDASQRGETALQSSIERFNFSAHFCKI